jgi:WD40 repeat protein
MAIKGNFPTSLVTVAAVALVLGGPASTARDRTGGGQKLVRSRRLGRPVRTTIPGIPWADLISVAWSPNGRYLAAAGRANRAVLIWNVKTGKEEHFWDDHSDSVGGVAWSPDGELLAAAEDDDTVCLWEPGTRQRVRVLDQPGEANPQRLLGDVVWSPDGSKVATNGSGVRIWDAATGRQAAELRLGWVRAMAWSPDGKWLATAGHEAVQVWDTTIWKERQGISETQAIHLTWSPDSLRLASSDYVGTIRVWDTATGRQLWEQYPPAIDGHWIRVPGHGKVWVYPMPPDNSIMIPTTGCIAWNPIRNVLASGADETVRIWDAVAGRQELVLRGNTDYVNGVAWSPDGKRLASCARDGAVWIWDLDLPRR